MSRICLVGAGNIARTHAEALATLPGLTVACVVDPDLGAATRLAGPGARAFASVEEALAEAAFDRAHVLVPPGLHAEVAAILLAAGKPVLLEKPLAADGEQCARLLASSAASGAALGVNQNFVHHPALVRLRDRLACGSIGRPRSVQCVYNVGLRQLAARQFGHWMFDTPANLLLEQAVHPLSQIAALAGPIGAARAAVEPMIEAGPGAGFLSVAVGHAGLRASAGDAAVRGGRGVRVLADHRGGR